MLMARTEVPQVSGRGGPSASDSSLSPAPGLYDGNANLLEQRNKITPGHDKLPVREVLVARPFHIQQRQQLLRRSLVPAHDVTKTH
jgi:hypothetical protein